MEGSENHQLPRFCNELNVPSRVRTQAVLPQHHGGTLQSSVEATVELNCKTVCFNQFFGDMNIFSSVLSKKG